MRPNDEHPRPHLVLQFQLIPEELPWMGVRPQEDQA
jgi:hypothetical protein